MPISTFKVTNVGPFDEVEFEFDPRVNVFIGPNNCGKTTALLALGNLAISGFRFPKKLLRGESRCGVVSQKNADGTYTRTQRPFPVDTLDDLPLTSTAPSKFEQWIRYIRDENAFRAYVPALRMNTDFRSEGPTPQPTTTPYAPWSIQNETIIQKIIDLDYQSYREKKPQIRKFLGQVMTLVSEITEGFPIRSGEVATDEIGYFIQFDTPDGLVPMNVLSQGTQALFQWCALLVTGYAEAYDFPESLDNKPGILIIDEIDAHLHPSWQRRILPALVNTFPSLQVFCSTHSPLTLSGLTAGQIHLMRRDAKGKISVSRNETDIRGWSADEIYTNLLDVEPTDLATTDKLDRLRQLRREETKLTREEERELETLRDEVHESLTGSPLAEQVDVLAQKLREAASDSSTTKPKRAAKSKEAKGPSSAKNRSPRPRRKPTKKKSTAKSKETKKRSSAKDRSPRPKRKT